MTSFRDGDSAKYARANRAYTKWCETIDGKLEQRYGKGHGMNMHGGLVAEKQRVTPKQAVELLKDSGVSEAFLTGVAPTPPTDWESRYKRLVGALEGLCEWAESYEYQHRLHHVVYSTDIRRHIKESA